jgi:hypothetical protein
VQGRVVWSPAAGTRVGVVAIMKRKLKLERETITDLGVRDLSRIVGGAVTDTAGCPGAPTVYYCTSIYCPSTGRTPDPSPPSGGNGTIVHPPISIM